MFDKIINELSYLPLLSSSLCMLAILLLRKYYMKGKIFAAIIYFIILPMVFILALGCGGVQNDAYIRLDEFKQLEKDNRLAEAKANPQQYSRMLQIDMEQFSNSNDFEEYLESYNSIENKITILFLGLITAALMEFLYFLLKFPRFLVQRKWTVTLKNI